MTKRISKQLNSFKYKGEPVKITIGTLAMVCFCILLLIVATFSQIDLPNFISYTKVVLGFKLANYQTLNIYKYIPQIPAIFFIVALLGRKFGLSTLISYIILGMFFPIFALGGGISYLLEYSFGYILAFVPVIFLVGTLLNIKPNFWKVLLITILGVFSIHILGILYMLFIAVLKHASMDLITSWISSLSGVQVIYDIIFTVVAIYLGKFIRKFLWIVMC